MRGKTYRTMLRLPPDRAESRFGERLLAGFDERDERDSAPPRSTLSRGSAHAKRSRLIRPM